MIARSFARNGWTVRHVVMGLCLMALAVAVTWQAWLEVWYTAIYDHQSRYLLLVLPVAAWMVWVRRERWRFCVPSDSLIGPALVILGAAMFIYGRNGLYPLIWHSGALLIVLSTMLSIAGPRLAMLFRPAFAVMLLLIPLPIALREQFSVPLQQMLAEVAWTLDWSLRLTDGMGGEGMAITHAHRAIAKACGSLEVIVSMFLLCSAFAFGRPLRPTVRVMMVLLAPLAALGIGMVGLVTLSSMVGSSPHWPGYLLQVGTWSVLAAAVLFLMGLIRILVWASVPIRPFALASEDY